MNIRNKTIQFINLCRLSQVGVVSYGSECPSHGVYARVTEVKHWIQFIARGAEDTNCNQEIPVQQGDIEYEYSDRLWSKNQNVDQSLYFKEC